MAPIVHDSLAPREIILPRREDDDIRAVSGALVISGAKLHFFSGSDWEVITSAAASA